MSAREKINKFNSVKKIQSQALNAEIDTLHALEADLSVVLEEKKNQEKNYWKSVEQINQFKVSGNLNQVAFSQGLTNVAQQKLMSIVKLQKDFELKIENQRKLIAHHYREIKAIEKLIETQSDILEQEIQKKLENENLEASLRMMQLDWND